MPALRSIRAFLTAAHRNPDLSLMTDALVVSLLFLLLFAGLSIPALT